MSSLLLGHALKARLHSRTRKLVLIKLVDHSREDGTRIYPGLQSIADDAECSISTARRTLREFCQVGLLRRVREGGSGPGSTAHYEMDVELLVRLKRDEVWPALEAAALHQPLPDSDEEDEPGHAPGDEQKLESGPPCENKGVTVEGFQGESLPNQGLRVPSDDTQTLSRNLNLEREGASARADGPASEGEPAAGEQAPTFEDFLEAYPHAKGDNRVQLRAAWEQLPFDQRRAAIDGIEAFSAERRAGGLKSRLSAPAYLSGRCWIGLEAKAGERKAIAAAGAPLAIAGWSRDWWLLLFDRIRTGQRIGFMVQQAERGGSWSASAADLAAAGKSIGELQPYLCNGPEIDAWRPWLLAKGARIPVFEGNFRVFLPRPLPPGGRQEEGDQDVRF